MKTMMKKTALYASIAAMSFAAGSAVADTQIATNGQGDLNFVPLAIADGGWSTEIDMINSSRYRSTVTKINIREQERSEECLDFLVYLSPGDRFTGKFMAAADLPAGTNVPAMLNGSPARLVFFSTDDSVRTLAGNPASVSSPAVYPIQENVDGQPNSCNIAYIEGIQSASFDLGPAVVDKTAIINAHESRKNTGGVQDQPGIPLDRNELPINTTSGSYTYSNPLNGVRMSNMMEAYQDYDNATYLSVSAATIIGRSTGYSSLPAGVETGNDGTQPGVVMVDRAMAKQNIIFPFENDRATATTSFGTFAVITFPTRQTLSVQQESSYDPFYNPGNVVPITTHIRDMEERIVACGNPDNTGGGIVSPPPPISQCENVTESLTQEVNVIDVRAKLDSIVEVNRSIVGDGGIVADPANFQKGWMNINLISDLEEDYRGAPAVASVIQFTLSPLGGIQGTVKSVAYTKGVESPKANGCDPYPGREGGDAANADAQFTGVEENDPPGTSPDSDSCAGSTSDQI